MSASHCPHCGLSVTTDTAFCPRCGKPIATAPKPNKSNAGLYVIIGLLLGLCLALLAWIFFSSNKKEDVPPSSTEVKTEETTSTSTLQTSTPTEQTIKPVQMSLWGTIGDSGDVDFEMEGTTGYYSYSRKGSESGRRTLKLESYDEKSGRCILGAYYQGEYIGKFDGIFNNIDNVDDEGEHHYGQSYQGKFLSVKGVEIDFYLYAD